MLLGVETVDWKGAWGGLPGADNTLFLDLVLITQAWSACENSLCCTFIMSTLIISVMSFFAAAALNNFRNYFRKLTIWQLLLSDIKQQRETSCGVLELACLHSLPNLKAGALTSDRLKSAMANAKNQSFPYFPAHHWITAVTTTKTPHIHFFCINDNPLKWKEFGFNINNTLLLLEVQHRTGLLPWNKELQARFPAQLKLQNPQDKGVRRHEHTYP